MRHYSKTHSLQHICRLKDKFITIKNKFVVLKTNLFLSKNKFAVQKTNLTVFIGNLFLGNLFSINLLTQRKQICFQNSKSVQQIGRFRFLKSPICFC